MMNEKNNGWLIGKRESEYLEIEFVSRPANIREEGYDWIKTKNTIRVGKFYGESKMTLTLSDVISFKNEAEALYEKLSGVAEFNTIEDQIGFFVEGDGKGHMKVKGYFRDDVSFGNELRFEIEIDQTELRKTILDLDKAIINMKKI
jgi:hypothetical protein